MKLLVSNGKRPASRAAFFCALAGFCASFSTAQEQDLAALSHTVKQLMAEGHFEEAIPICEQLVKAMPGNPGLVLNLGMAEEMARTPEPGGPAVRRGSESRTQECAGSRSHWQRCSSS